MSTTESSIHWPDTLTVNAGIFDSNEKRWIEQLLSMGQQHVFNDWDRKGVNDEEKHKFFEQLEQLDQSCGVQQYLERAKVLLTSAKAGENPFDGWMPKVPSGVNLTPLTSEYKSFEDIGIQEVGKCGFVLVAGGLGERLGYNGIKIELPSQTVTRVCYLELYCQQILAMQARYVKSADHFLPLAIMVSEDTEQKTIALLEANSYFGMRPGQISLMKQGKVPALLDNDARIAMSSAYEINAKPHGHGDVHSLMFSTGMAEKWKSSGTEWVIFFQDTNGLAFYPLPAMLGVSVSLGLEVNSMAVDRAAKQSIGAITKLIHSDGREMTINVEYNQLDPLLRATFSAEGDVNDPVTGFSPFPGNINQLLFRMEPYLHNLHLSRGLMPEFVNPKYADSTRTAFKKPTRLECMMQDYPKLLAPGAKVGFTTAPAWMCYSPCKNNPTDAAASLAAGIPASAPFTAESDQYLVFAELLRRMGADIAIADECSVLGVSGKPGPRLVFHPSFVLFPHELAERFVNPGAVHLTERSTLVVEGDVVVEALNLDGSLSLQAVPDTKIIVKASDLVENAGHSMILLAGDGSKLADTPHLKEGTECGKVESQHSDQLLQVTEADLMRGYLIVCNESKVACTKQCIPVLEDEVAAAEETAVLAEVNEGSKKKVRRGTVTRRRDFVFNGKCLIDSAAYDALSPLPRDGDRENATTTCHGKLFNAFNCMK